MAKFTGWKKRYSYLDDYKKGMDGKYVYYGRHYVLKEGSPSFTGYKWILGIMDFLLTALFVAGGLIDAGAIWRTWYVVAPYMMEVLALFFLVWRSFKLLFEKMPVKEYIYKKSVPWLTPLNIILAIVCLLSAVAALICLLTLPEEVKLSGCIVYIVIKLVSAALSLISIWLRKSYVWEPDPSEEMK